MAKDHAVVPTMEEILDPIAFRWKRLRELATTRLERLIHSRKESISIRAVEVTLARTDPSPRDPLVQIDARKQTVIVWDLSASEVPPAGLSASPRTARNAMSCGGSGDSTSWSVTADGEKPPSP